MILTLLAGCQPQRGAIPIEQPPPWGYADLRLLDPPDASAPWQDLAAVYLRTWRGEVQIRLDLLDSAPPPDYDLYLAFDTQAGGSTSLPIAAVPGIPWDMLIVIPANGGITVAAADSRTLQAARLHTLRDTALDTVSVHFDEALLPTKRLPFSLQVFVTSPQSRTPADSSSPIRSDAPPPPPIPLLIAFDETFPAVTPAQALRRWDGAHSGPNRARHGLRHLLAAVAENRVPVALLDLNAPSALSALDYVGGLSTVQTLASQGLLSLPAVDVAQSCVGFELAARPVGIPADSATLSAAEPQVTPHGLSLELRRLLLAQVASPEQRQAAIQVLHANLVQSAWGEPQAAKAALHYIAQHPWLRPLGPYDLAEPSATTSSQSLAAVPPFLQAALGQAPPGLIRDAAWQMAAMLSAPASPPLQRLHTAYINQTGHLLAAARWNAAPAPRADCIEDVDWDGRAECILASENFFAILETDGARMSVAFSRQGDGVHQIIAPSYQFAVGLSDPAEWDSARGLAADPTAIPGAFSDNLHTWDTYIPTALPGQISFSLPDGSLHKTFTLTTDGLQVSYRSEAPLLTRIPLAVDAWERFGAGWGRRYESESIADGWLWGLEPGPRLRLQTDGELNFHAFNDSQAFITLPEDPNFDYGAGHYLPFPLALAEVYGRQFEVKIALLP